MAIKWQKMLDRLACEKGLCEGSMFADESKTGEQLVGCLVGALAMDAKRRHPIEPEECRTIVSKRYGVTSEQVSALININDEAGLRRESRVDRLKRVVKTLKNPKVRTLVREKPEVFYNADQDGRTVRQIVAEAMA